MLVIVAVLGMARWAVLRLMGCEGCGVPFSAAGALYRVVTFEEHRCRRCREEERWSTTS